MPDDSQIGQAARKVFATALATHQCEELWTCLTEGGAATVDARSGRLVFITEAQVQAMDQRVAGESPIGGRIPAAPSLEQLDRGNA